MKGLILLEDSEAAYFWQLGFLRKNALHAIFGRLQHRLQYREVCHSDYLSKASQLITDTVTANLHALRYSQERNVPDCSNIFKM